MTHLIDPLAEPYTQGEIARFEALIFISSNDAPKIRLSARAALARFVNKHGQAKCNLMLAALTKWHEKPQRPDA
jgi:hypothetical protein